MRAAEGVLCSELAGQMQGWVGLGNILVHRVTKAASRSEHHAHAPEILPDEVRMRSTDFRGAIDGPAS